MKSQVAKQSPPSGGQAGKNGVCDCFISVTSHSQKVALTLMSVSPCKLIEQFTLETPLMPLTHETLAMSPMVRYELIFSMNPIVC